ncbi:MAG TPA: hypothetical protein VN969_07935 [Streptosporangiaceae bacterium]|jgi:hypothetical protein|nr:hypothetical protein [Streptosporangiaceae bacterium]
MVHAAELGYARSIGVSSFGEAELADVAEICGRGQGGGEYEQARSQARSPTRPVHAVSMSATSAGLIELILTWLRCGDFRTVRDVEIFSRQAM